MSKSYKICIVGLGSIGKRHLLNIVKILNKRGASYSIDLLRSNSQKDIDSEVKNLINNIYFKMDDVPNDYDVIFITNPTHLHYDTVKDFVVKTSHMFIEKPVFDSVELSIEQLNLKKNATYYVACPLRYTKVIQYLKNNIDLTKVYSARVICSSYLPEWRPNTDYRNTYSAHKDQGGGVSIDLIHEWDYVQYLFGFPNELFNFRGKFSNLEIDSDDLSIYIAKYDQMTLEVHLDYFGRKNIREIQLFTDEDTIIGDLINSEVRYLKSGKTLSFNEERDDFQLKEMEHFFNILEGKEMNPNNIDTALNTLKIAKEGTL